MRPQARSLAAATWPLIARFAEADRRLAARAARERWSLGIYEFVRFGVKQAWACLFGGALVALIVATHLWYPPGAAVARYDVLFIAALTLQVAMLALRLETFDEARVIVIFHVIGTAMEIFKTDAGSWIYPEAGVLRIGAVPLFSGFMYASIGSYIARCWRLFDFRFTHHPPLWSCALLSVAIYVNFYSHHFLADMRGVLFVACAALFARCFVYYRIWRVHRRMPLLLGLFLVAAFIWLAENIGTATSTWSYPHQLNGWSAVKLAKLGSWFLLLVVSYTLVAATHRPRRPHDAADDATR